MKKIVLITLLIIGLGYGLSAQTKEDRRYIEVTGQAELKVVPNEIYLSISLNEKLADKRHSLAELEKDVVTVLRKLNIPTENLSISGASSKLEKAFWTGKRIYAKKDYILKLTHAENIGKLISELKKQGISNVNLHHVDNSEMEKYRKQVKIKAIKAAKEKADYLLEAIGEKTAKPIYIQERNYQPYYSTRSNAMLTKSMMYESEHNDSYQLEFKEMTLKYEVFARFEIAE